MKEYYDVPVVLFVFRRLETVKMIFEVFKEVKPKTLYIFADGARNSVNGENEKVEEVRKYITNNITWQCDLHSMFREQNVGYAKNIRDGITLALNEKGQAVIMEDDAIPKIEFFYFCEEMLNLYKHDKRISYIAGFNAVGDLDISDNYLYSFGKTTPMSGAIATWADRWNDCDFDISNWKENKKNKKFRKYFFGHEIYKVVTNGFDDAYKRPNDEWDVQFQYDLLDKERFSIAPKGNLAKSYGYLEASHEQGDRVAKNLAKHMDYTRIEFTFPLKKRENVEWDKEYDKQRQKIVLMVHGNYIQRHLDYLYMFIKNCAYKLLPSPVWHLIKKVFF